MHKNWQELIKPSKLGMQPGTDGRRMGSIVAEPLERGYGLTLGNALRRVLLSSLQGAAVTDIVLNIKSLALRMHGEGTRRMRLKSEKPGEVTAGMIETGSDIEIMNP